MTNFFSLMEPMNGGHITPAFRMSPGAISFQLSRRRYRTTPFDTSTTASDIRKNATKSKGRAGRNLNVGKSWPNTPSAPAMQTTGPQYLIVKLLTFELANSVFKESFSFEVREPL